MEISLRISWRQCTLIGRYCCWNACFLWHVALSKRVDLRNCGHVGELTTCAIPLPGKYFVHNFVLRCTKFVSPSRGSSCENATLQNNLARFEFLCKLIFVQVSWCKHQAWNLHLCKMWNQNAARVFHYTPCKWSCEQFVETTTTLSASSGPTMTPFDLELLTTSEV